MPARSGQYPIARRAGEIERLRIQAAAMEFDAGVLLDRIGVGPGWRCLDLGCGPGGILHAAERPGGRRGARRRAGRRPGPAGGRPGRGSEAQRLSNVELVEGDAYRSGLPARHLRSGPRPLPRRDGRTARRPAPGGDPPGPAGRRGGLRGARHGHAQLPSAPSGLGPSEGRPAGRRSPASARIRASPSGSTGSSGRPGSRTSGTGRSWWGSRAGSRWPTTCRPRSNRSDRP